MEFVEIAVYDPNDNQVFQWVIREYDVNAPQWVSVHSYLDDMAAAAYRAGAKIQYGKGPNLMTMPWLLRQVYSNMALQKLGDTWHKREFPTLQHGREANDDGTWNIDALSNGWYLDATWYPGED